MHQSKVLHRLIKEILALQLFSLCRLAARSIDAAFSGGGSSGVSGGISTSIAVFCHELPHELGK